MQVSPKYLSTDRSRKIQEMEMRYSLKMVQVARVNSFIPKFRPMADE